MPNTQMPNMPGMSAMTDTLDFVKNLWGSMSVPGLTAPTLSVEELDKKIGDLKAVEAWLNLNMSMLRGSIQALEVQRGTIATLKSVGASLATAVNQGASDKSIFDANPYVSAFFHHAREAGQQGGPMATPKAAAAPAPAPTPAPAAAAGGSGKPGPEAAAKAPPGDTSAAAQMANPAMWWNMLQDQFKQAVTATMATDAMTSAAARAGEAAAKFAAAAGAKPTGAATAAKTPAAAAAPKAAASAGKPKAAARKAPAKKRAPAKAVKPATDQD